MTFPYIVKSENKQLYGILQVRWSWWPCSDQAPVLLRMFAIAILFTVPQGDMGKSTGKGVILFRLVPEPRTGAWMLAVEVVPMPGHGTDIFLLQDWKRSNVQRYCLCLRTRSEHLQCSLTEANNHYYHERQRERLKQTCRFDRYIPHLTKFLQPCEFVH